MGFLGFYLPGFDFLKLCHIAFVVLLIEIDSIAMVGCCVMSGETILCRQLLRCCWFSRGCGREEAKARHAFALKNAQSSEVVPRRLSGCKRVCDEAAQILNWVTNGTPMSRAHSL